MQQPVSRRALTALDIAALSLVTIGALNWGLSAINFNLVRRLFGRGSVLERTTYALVGLAGLDVAWLTARFLAGGYQTPAPTPSQMRERIARQAQQIGESIERGTEQAARQAQQIGQPVEQAGEEYRRGYQQPGMRP